MDLTHKQEAFCNAYIETGNASEAYRRVYGNKAKPETVAPNASRLLANSKVSARIKELQAPAAKKAQMTLESHLQRLDELSKAAEAANQLSAAIAAEIARGKLC
jgi:phage terminase small subunit